MTPTILFTVIAALIFSCIVIGFMLIKARKDSDEAVKRRLEDLEARIKSNQEQLKKLK